MPNQHDDAVEKVLAALKTAAPPEGMDARIAERLRQAQAATAAPPWRNRIAASLPTVAWWRGALTGAALATFAAACVILIGQHRSQPTPVNSQVAATTPATAVSATPVDTPLTKPCAGPNTFQVRTAARLPMAVPSSRLETVHPESLASSRPAPEPGLTTQERQLLRLTKIADPKQLATLNPETQAKLEEQQEAEFQKFFPPPPPLPEPQPIGDKE